MGVMVMAKMEVVDDGGGNEDREIMLIMFVMMTNHKNSIFY